MAIAEDRLYDELGRAWQYFATWREKIFAGYLSVLAVLAYAFSNKDGPSFHAAVFGFAILVSAVFRMLDYRTTDLVDLCQRAGESLAGSKGIHSEVERGRFGTKGRASYGLAVDTLVAGVAGTSAAGFISMLVRWHGNDVGGWWWSIVAVALAFALWMGLRFYTCKIWWEKQAEWQRRHARRAAVTEEKPAESQSSEDPENRLSRMERITILLKEYDTLRSEIIARTAVGSQVVGLAVVLFVAWITSLGTHYDRFLARSLLAGFIIAVILGCVTAYVGIGRPHRKVVELESQINELAGERLLTWEGSISFFGLRQRTRL